MDAQALDKARVVSPYEEAIAFEYLYSRDGMTLKRIAERTAIQGVLPTESLRAESGLFPPDLSEVRRYMDGKIGSFGIAVRGTPSWPEGIDRSARPTPVVYWRGDIDLLSMRSVSIVGSRKSTGAGRARASKLARQLSARGVAVATGLARGIDTAATEAALAYKGPGGERGHAIGVIGTPIDEAYPRENEALQDEVARSGLLLSQVPFFRYSRQAFETKRYYFPERNELMAAVTDATVIVEASDTSGTLSQARACAHQGKPLFIMRSCAENPAISWPGKWLERDNVHVIDSVEDIMERLPNG